MVGMDPAQSCDDPCAQARQDDIALSNGARDLANAYQQVPMSREGTDCASRAPGMHAIADRFDSYGNAIPSARAADDLNRLGDKNSADVTAPCLERLPLDADALNRELGIPPGSPNAITDADLRNDQTGHRAAIYRSKTDGKLIMVSRDTQRRSLVDWKTNIENGQGFNTDQYASTRRLTNKLTNSGQSFDIAGYSKGGGLAQEAGLLSPNSNVYVFNSAGLHENSLARTGQSSFDSLARRTSSFSSEGDFLTFMNNTTDPAREVRNARFLRDHLAGNATGVNPMKILYENPAHEALRNQRSRRNPELKALQEAAGEQFQTNLNEFLQQVDGMIEQAASTPGYDRLFPPVRAGSHETVPNSMTWLSRRMNGENAEASLGKLNQHKMENVLGPMEKQLKNDRATLQRFMSQCGS